MSSGKAKTKTGWCWPPLCYCTAFQNKFWLNFVSQNPNPNNQQQKNINHHVWSPIEQLCLPLAMKESLRSSLSPLSLACIRVVQKKMRMPLATMNFAAKHLRKFMGVFWHSKHNKWLVGWKWTNPGGVSPFQTNQFTSIILRGLSVLDQSGLMRRWSSSERMATSRGHIRGSISSSKCHQHDKGCFGWAEAHHQRQPTHQHCGATTFEHTCAIKTTNKVIANLTVIVEQRIKLHLGDVAIQEDEDSEQESMWSRHCLTDQHGLFLETSASKSTSTCLCCWKTILQLHPLAQV